MKINRLTIFKKQLPFGLAAASPFTYKKDVWVIFDLVFSQTILIFFLLMKANHRKRLFFIWESLYFNLYLYVSNRKSLSALYSLPSTEKSLFSSLALHFCYFLDKVKELFISKKQPILVSILLLLAQLVIHLFFYIKHLHI